MNETPNTEPENPESQPIPQDPTDITAPETTKAVQEPDAPPPVLDEPHPAHAVLDEIQRNLDVQMNVGWLRKKLDQVRSLL